MWSPPAGPRASGLCSAFREMLRRGGQRRRLAPVCLKRLHWPGSCHQCASTCYSLRDDCAHCLTPYWPSAPSSGLAVAAVAPCKIRWPQQPECSQLASQELFLCQRRSLFFQGSQTGLGLSAESGSSAFQLLLLCSQENTEQLARPAGSGFSTLTDVSLQVVLPTH